MKKFLSHVQGLLGLFIAGVLFFLSDGLIRHLDPTAGAFDFGYLQKPILTAVYLIFITSVVWIVFQVDFPTVDRWIDRGGFRSDWEDLMPKERVNRVFLILIALFIGAISILLSL